MYGSRENGNSTIGRKSRDDSPSLLSLDQFAEKPHSDKSSEANLASNSPTSPTKFYDEVIQEGEDAGGEGDDDDPRVKRLLQEADLWTAASHALWTVWGIVQAKEDILKRIEVWKAALVLGAEGAKEEVHTDFDYLSYSAGRMALFREELIKLKVLD